MCSNTLDVKLLWDLCIWLQMFPSVLILKLTMFLFLHVFTDCVHCSCLNFIAAILFWFVYIFTVL